MDTKKHSKQKKITNLPVIIDDNNTDTPDYIVPQSIKSSIAKQHYNPVTVQKIIIDVATTMDPVENICKKYNINASTIGIWRMSDSRLMTAWRTAMAARAHAMADKMESEINGLEAIVDNKDEDTRYKATKVKTFDVKWRHREWLMKSINKRDFGDNIQQDINVNVNPVEQRAKAWQLHQGVKEADVTVVDTSRDQYSPEDDAT